MTDAEILTLVDRLERCLFSPSEFHHKDHLAVAAPTRLMKSRRPSGPPNTAYSIERSTARSRSVIVPSPETENDAHVRGAIVPEALATSLARVLVG